MTDNERDTKFLGFAKLFVDDTQVLGFKTRAEFETYTAQRAYDLACHVLYETSYGMDKWDIIGRVNNTPDMTEWPPMIRER